MKGIKKLLTGILAATMIMGMSITAYAGESQPAQQQGHLTITETNKGQEYKVYKVFDAVATPDGTGFNYKLVAGKTEAPAGFTVDAAGNVFYTANMNLEEGATAVTELTADDIAAIKAYVTEDDFVGSITEDGNDGKVDFALGYGYYYIETTTGVAVSINTNEPNAVIVDKNDVPTIEKTVQEDSNSNYQKQNDAEIGQKVYFATEVNVKKGGLGYVLHDKMSNGLTFDENDLANLAVHVGSIDGTALGKGTAYTAEAGGTYKKNSADAGTDGTFTVTFKDEYTGALTEDVTLYVTYTATLNSNAQVKVKELNDTVLKYGNDGYTDEKETWTFTWGLKINKVIKGTETPLAGAKFALYKVVGGVAQFAVLDADNKVSGWVPATDKAVADLVKEEESYFTNTIKATVLTTGTDGALNFYGLDADTYYALEVAAPAGYNKLPAAEMAEITSDSRTTGLTLTSELSAGSDGVFIKTVENGTGALLPSTGGIGTTIFYIVGGLLIIAGVAYFIVRRKANAQ